MAPFADVTLASETRSRAVIDMLYECGSSSKEPSAAADICGRYSETCRSLGKSPGSIDALNKTASDCV